MKLLHSFDEKDRPPISQVGGKGLSLILMAQQGLPVPGGFVLTVAFFRRWFEIIKGTPEWAQLMNGPADRWKQNCDELKKRCNRLELDPVQKKLFSEALASLNEDGKSLLTAVRSSSPEEDLEGASFAGGYETSLGVTLDKSEEALRRSFASCLDERVMVYKREHGFRLDEPRIAVVVQRQIPSEKAGVAFSLNPLNNCYDEAVINANFGLGESVVSGRITPDTFIVDKPGRSIIERRVGKKETSIWLTPTGGTYSKPSPSRAQACLSDEEVLAISEMVTEVESFYGKPMDIEWAYAEGKLYLLQARPITAYVPLPEGMLTKPGEPRTLYIDITMYKQGINRPMSVMGLDYWERFQKAIAGTNGLFGMKDSMMINAGGRTYSNMSLGLKLRPNKKQMAAAVRVQDALSAEIVENLDDSYIAEKLPRRLLAALVIVALKRAGTLFAAFRAFSDHKKFHRSFRAKIADLEKALDETAAKQLSSMAFASACIELFEDYLMYASLPVTVAAEMARSRIKKLFKEEPPEIREKLRYLERALPNNITIEMGLDMYRLSGFDEPLACDSAEEFAIRIKQRAFPSTFMRAWDQFIARYGMRCPLELDVATPRFYESPEAIYAQLRMMALNADESTNPQRIYEAGVAEREAAYDFLLSVAHKKGKRFENKFKKYFDILVTLGGYRETLKYYLIVIVGMFRKRALAEAKGLVDNGRLDTLQQVFDLTVEELDNCLADTSLDLRALSAENVRFLRKAQRVRNFPLLIDSRGKILRAPKKDSQDGEVLGEPISVGRVRGKTKVLRRPDEKPVLPGEILVARATDPGWTPLFLNASGVILEIGGVLQHGALVAREYGKPCVAGVDEATTIFKDGMLVELDGANGVVRIIESN